MERLEYGPWVAEQIAGSAGHVNYDAVPNVVYTDPELAMVGRTEAELKEAGVSFNSGRFMFRANGRAKSLAKEAGMVKILADKESDRIVGVHMVGPDAAEIVQGFAVALKAGATKTTFDGTVGIHPTAAEELVTMRTPARSHE